MRANISRKAKKVQVIMVYYEQRKPRLVLRNGTSRRPESPRLVLRQQRQEPPFQIGDNPTDIPLHMSHPQERYHGNFQNINPGGLSYAFANQLPMAYNVPLNMNMVPGHLAFQPDNTRNIYHEIDDHSGRVHELGGVRYAGYIPVLGERRNENTGRVSPRVALRTMMQQASRPNTQPEKFGRQTHYTQHSHYPRGASRPDSRGFSVGSDVSVCPPIDRNLEAHIREQLARSGLLRDCPEPEYVNRPMVVDPSIISCGRALKQQNLIHHRRPQYFIPQQRAFEDAGPPISTELPRAQRLIVHSPLKAQRNMGVSNYNAAALQSNVQQIQTYRGVDSAVQGSKRRDSHQAHSGEAGSKFLTKDDYTPTRQIIGYWVNPPSESPRSPRKISVQPLKPQDDTTPKPRRIPVKNNFGGASEPELREAPIRERKVKANKSEEIPKKEEIPSNKTAEQESLIKPIGFINTHATIAHDTSSHPNSQYASGIKRHDKVTVQDISDEETDESPDCKRKADFLEDCIKSLETWDKRDRKVLRKLLNILKTLDGSETDDVESKPVKKPEIAHEIPRSPRKERGSNSSLNPNAACFNDFKSATVLAPQTRKGNDEQREEILPTSDEILAMPYPKPHVPAEPIWVKTQPNKLIKPSSALPIPSKTTAGRKVPVKTIQPRIPREDEEGRVAKAIDQRLAEPLLARFHEKYPLTGTICTNPPSPTPVSVKNAAEIQEELERLLLQEKEKKAFANPSAFAKPRVPRASCQV